MTAMTSEHPLWDDFADLMLDEAGECHHDKRQARAILTRMDLSEEEIEESMRWFEHRGGFCDCEIRMNVVLS
jgi:hypothetical protein